MASCKICDVCGRQAEFIFERQMIPKLRDGQLFGWVSTDLCTECEIKYEEIYYPAMIEVAKKWEKIISE